MTAVDTSKMWSNAKGISVGMIPGRALLGPLCLLIFAPTFVITLYHILVNLDGSSVFFLVQLRSEGVLNTFMSIWPTMLNLKVWKMMLTFFAFEIFLLQTVPGKRFKGPTTPSGHVPEYTANGMQCYFITLFTYVVAVYFGLWKGSIIYDNIGKILASSNLFALGFCALLYVKGLTAPSTADCGSSGNIVFDYYWGTELYPRIFGVDVKQFTNCRAGMMFWPLMVLSCAFKQYDDNGTLEWGSWANLILQLVYLTKFFWWESGYMCTIDIMHDRAGFYLCWGVLVWLPCLYTSHSMFLAEHPSQMPLVIAAFTLVFGLVMIWMNYDCDRQRQDFRAVNGRCKIWGKDPFFIEATFVTEKGEKKKSLLLGSGWWGISRHFHYIPEVLGALAWTLPVWTSSILPYTYVIFLTILLFDRAVRDDARCRSKYGKYWDDYCKQVPYMVLPGIF